MWRSRRGTRCCGGSGHLDFAFGTHNVRLVPRLAEAARAGERAARVEESRSLERFDLPDRHPAFEGSARRSAFVTVMEGCDLFCSFCIVPRTRGREISRPAAGILAEVAALAARGVREVVLLGQTVNAYGRHDLRRGRDEAGVVPFAELLARIAAVPGIDRIRYTSPHPAFFDAALVRGPRRARRALPSRPPPGPERLRPRPRPHAPALRRRRPAPPGGGPPRGPAGPRRSRPT